MESLLAPIKVNLVPAFLPFHQIHKRFKFAHGGRGSAKSTGIGTTLLLKGRERKLRILCTREIQKSIKDSVHTLLKDIINKYGFEDYHVLDTTIRNKVTGTEFIFIGLREHNIMSLKSYEGVDICWVEEAQAVVQKSLDILTPTIRKAGSEIWFSYNRLNGLDPVHKRFMRECKKSVCKKIFKTNFKTWKKDNTFNWYEFNGDDAIGIFINYDGNPYFPEELRKEMEEDKEDNPILYKHKWRGEPQSIGDRSLISRERALQAINRQVKQWDYVSFGVDPARYGDDESVICIRKGFRILPVNKFNGINTSELTGRVLMFARLYWANGYKEPIKIKVDDTGVGAGVTDQLENAAKEENKKAFEDKQFNIIVIPVINNGVATNPKYVDIGTQMWGNMGEAIKTMSLPDDMILIEQMATREYEIKPDGRIKLESKEQMKKRSLTSPDRADALALCLEEDIMFNLNFDGGIITEQKKTFEGSRYEDTF